MIIQSLRSDGYLSLFYHSSSVQDTLEYLSIYQYLENEQFLKFTTGK